MSFEETQVGASITAFDAFGLPEPLTATADGFDASLMGPSRRTIWVPSERVTVNMGAPVHSATSTASLGTFTESRGPITIDAGFVVQTDNHVHFHTFGFPTDPLGAPTGELDPLERTVLRLGSPTRVLTAVAGEAAYKSEVVNAIGTPLVLGSVYTEPHKSWDGFAMLTGGGAYQESRGNHVIVSGENDLRLAGKRSVLVGSSGNVHIAANPSASVDTFARNRDNDSISTDVGLWHGQHDAEKAIQWATDAIKGTYDGLLLIEQVFHMKFARKPMEGLVGWQEAGMGEAVTAVLGLLAGIVGRIVGLNDLTPEGADGNIAMFASKGLNAYAARTASMHSGLSTSVSSMVAAQLSGSVVASVSSSAAAMMSGTFTSVSGVASASLTSQLGSVRVVGRSSTEVSSYGKIHVTSRNDLQLNSTEHKVFVHGKDGFYIGAGAGERTEHGMFGPISDGAQPVVGYAMSGTRSVLKIGRMKDVGNFGNSDPDPKIRILVKDDCILLKHTHDSDESSVKLQGANVHIKSRGRTHIE